MPVKPAASAAGSVMVTKPSIGPRVTPLRTSPGWRRKKNELGRPLAFEALMKMRF